jgi:hypothetical protein
VSGGLDLNFEFLLACLLACFAIKVDDGLVVLREQKEDKKKSVQEGNVQEPFSMNKLTSALKI